MIRLDLEVIGYFLKIATNTKRGDYELYVQHSYGAWQGTHRHIYEFQYNAFLKTSR